MGLGGNPLISRYNMKLVVNYCCVLEDEETQMAVEENCVVIVTVCLRKFA